MLESRAILGLGLALLYGVAIIVSARRSKPVFFALILILLPLLPVFYFPGIGEIKFGERYLYFPSVGLTILLASLIGWGTARLPRTGNIALTAFAAILTATYAFATVSRNADWKDDSTLFRDAQAKLGFSQSGEEQKSSGASPGSSFLVLDQAEIENNFGNISYNDGKYDKAIEHYTKAVTIQPDYAEALYNIGSVYYDMKQYDKTIDYCQKAINSRPEYAEAYSLMGMASSNIGRADDAMKYLQAALRIDPDNAESHYNLAIVYGNKGLTKDAVQELKYALRIRPDFAEAKNALSQLVSARK
jgi:tetratricopeptide (TPR) repeat protein